MKKSNYLKKSLKLEDYSNGVNRVLLFLSTQTLRDEFLAQKAVELKHWDAELFAFVGKNQEARIGVREKSDQLSRELSSLRLVLKSLAKHCGDDQSSVTMEGIKVVESVIGKYGLVSRLAVSSKITVTRAMVRDLREGDAQLCVEMLGIGQKVDEIEAAVEALVQQQAILAQAMASPEAKIRLLDLKNGSKEIINAVGHYLQGMSQVNPTAFEGPWKLFCSIIDDANRRSYHIKAESQDEKAADVTVNAEQAS